MADADATRQAAKGCSKRAYVRSSDLITVSVQSKGKKSKGCQRMKKLTPMVGLVGWLVGPIMEKSLDFFYENSITF